MTSFAAIHPTIPKSRNGISKSAIKCADGFTMSVQASSFHYCTPRTDKGPHTAFEVGFPSERVEALMPYAEDAETPTETVYGWVPVEIIDAIISEHGGITDYISLLPDSAETPSA